MFKAVIETDKTFGKQQTHYYLTQGDSCVIRATPHKDGELLPLEQIEKCLFKLSDEEYKEIFSKQLVEEDGKLVLRLTSAETTLFPVAKYYYEIEYTLMGGEVNTPHQWKFDILDQIIE